MLPLLGAGPLQGPPLLITQQEQTAFPAAGRPDDICAVPVSPRMLRLGRRYRQGPPILVTQTIPTVFPPAGEKPDTMNVLTPPRLMGLGVSMGGPPILVNQGSYVPVEVVTAVGMPVTHPLVKFRLARGGRIGPVLLTQQAQHQAGPLNFVLTQAGTLTTSAALVRTVSARVSGVLTTAGALIRSAAMTARGTLSTASALVYRVAVTVSGAISPAGSMVRRMAITMIGALPMTATLARSAQIIRQGVLTTASVIARAVSAKISGALTATSDLATIASASTTAKGSLAVTGTLALTKIPLLKPVFSSPSDTAGVSVTYMPWDGVTHGKGEVSS